MSASLEPVERPVTTTGRKVDTAAHPNPRTSRGGSSFESTARPAPVTSAASYPRRPADGGAPTALCPAPRPNRACSGVEVLVPRPLGASTAGSDMPAVGLQHASVSLTACASWAGSSLVTAPPAPAASTACDLEVPANGGADTAVSPPPRGVWGSARASIFAPLAPERSESPASRLKMPADGRSYTAMGPAPAAGPEAPTGGGAKAALSPAACTSPGEPSLGVFAPSPPDTSTVRFEAPAGGGPVAVATCSPRASRGAFSTAVATPLPPGASPPSSYMVLATPTSFRTPGGAYVPPPDLNPSQPSFGSVKTFSQVKAKRALREQLGNDTVVTPVRRSARKSNAKPTASVTALLEAAHYSYAPNAYLP
ncbi:hypothetical protein PLESTB_000642200 [Pleodorina starrii]|uniref:Uncharacterized protein n=1 Tax=Pleodorina starrii TaxID=330485 RepID=A0A9W6BJ46_9CHLO|nr:hypothetical protein PLESTB_000642200 [Pleodorina starrii]GLC71552.1 hypothetical protein PLESTF_001134400 [Pleodorina starrii]